MNTHESYVSLETAKLLKDAGFNWECKESFRELIRIPLDDNPDIKLPDLPLPYYLACDSIAAEEENSFKINFYPRPTLEVAQRWLREIKVIHICVKPNEASANCKYFVTVIANDTKWGNIQDDNGKTIMFDNYEEAQESGIKKALELILEKGE